MRDPSASLELVPGMEALHPGLGRLLIVVGVFDGLHRGHLYLLRQLRRGAALVGARPAVVTFDAHPDEIIRGAAPPVICDPSERLVRLAAAGVEVAVVQHFDVALRMTPFEAFIAQIQARVELAGFLMTPDAAFGHDRLGTPETIASLGETAGFRVLVVPPLELDGRPVRSTEIRSAIGRGELAAARHLLGRSVAVAGTAVPAPIPDERTAGLRFELPVAMPPPGRYRAWVEPAWSPGAARPGGAVRATAMVGPGPDELTVLARNGLPPGRRLRVAFVG